MWEATIKQFYFNLSEVNKMELINLCAILSWPMNWSVRFCGQPGLNMLIGTD